MPRPTILALSGNVTRPSKTFGLVLAIAGAVAQRERVEVDCLDLVDSVQELSRTLDPSQAHGSVRALLRAIETADALIVGSAVYKGSYPGLFKHVFDLLDPNALAGKPVILAATGGSDRHALMLDHALRPLFGFFGAVIVPTAIYATDRDFRDGKPVSPAVIDRIQRAADEFGRLLSVPLAVPALQRIA